MERHPRVDAVRPYPEPGHNDSEEGEDRKAVDETVRRSEEPPGRKDREPCAPWLQQRDSEPPIREFFDRRGHERDDEEERDERGRAARVPTIRDQSLLVGRAP